MTSTRRLFVKAEGWGFEGLRSHWVQLLKAPKSIIAIEKKGLCRWESGGRVFYDMSDFMLRMTRKREREGLGRGGRKYWFNSQYERWINVFIWLYVFDWVSEGRREVPKLLLSRKTDTSVTKNKESQTLDSQLKSYYNAVPSLLHFNWDLNLSTQNGWQGVIGSDGLYWGPLTYRRGERGQKEKQEKKKKKRKKGRGGVSLVGIVISC